MRSWRRWATTAARATRISRRWPRSASCSRVAVARDVPVLGLCYGGQVLAAVLGARVGPAPVAWSSAGVRSRPTMRAPCRRGRGWSGTSTASPRRPAPPSSRARPRPRRRSGSARISACSSTRRPPSTSWRPGRAPMRSGSRRSGSATARRCSPRRARPREAAEAAAFRLFDAFLASLAD